MTIKNLSAQEIKTLKALAAGMTCKQFASQEKISISTVKYYVVRACAKLKTKTTPQTVAVAIWAGILTPDEKQQEPAQLA